jgi:4'-phosphopantetheinyl transferase
VSTGAAPCGALELFPLDIDAAAITRLDALLSPAERARAARFHSPRHAQRFIVAHARLRELLAPLLGIAPAQIEFAAGPHGKPALSGAAAAAGIQFNLSHSDGMGFIGWARGREIGVDVECWRALRDEAALVRRFFSRAEIAAYEALPEAQRRAGFFALWTRKEAYVKAVGRGLGLPLHSFDVNLEQGEGARLLRPSAHCDDGRCWSLAAPHVAEDLSLAVVLEADGISLRRDPEGFGRQGCD